MNGGEFADRRAAGRELAREVAALGLHDPVVLALPRGGVPVGFEVARTLGVPLEVLLVRKIGAPGHGEFGIGAVVDGAPHQTVINEDTARMVGATPEYIERQVTRELAEIERRRGLYHCGPPPAARGRPVILVDDGIATGGTARAALQSLAHAGAALIVLAVPVAPEDTLAALAPLCDRVVCLVRPAGFRAVGAHYRDFRQTSDEEVIGLLAEARRLAGRGGPAPADAGAIS